MESVVRTKIFRLNEKSQDASIRPKRLDWNGYIWQSVLGKEKHFISSILKVNT